MEIDILARINTHIFAIFICIVILADIRKQDVYPQYAFRFYLILVKLCILNTLLEATTWLIQGHVTQQFHIVFITVYFAIIPIPQLFWSLYIQTYFSSNRDKLYKNFPQLCIPVIISEILLLTNYFFPFIFYIDSIGHYHRLWGYPLFMVSCYLLLGYTIIRIIYERKQIQPNLFWPLVFFHVPPLVGGILQGLAYGSSFIWPGMTLSLLICYINIQNKRIVTDYLTGAYNRLEMDRYINQKISNAEGPSFFGILIDIDNFKEINDNCGHVLGDEILIKTVELLQKSITSKDFLARYGGDEFLIIVNEETTDKIIQTIERIENNITKFNEKNSYPFNLSLSLGYELYDVKKPIDVMEFLKKIDSNMYNAKYNK